MSFSGNIGLLTEVDGSSQVECEDTKVICAVTGPIEPKARQELPTQLALEIIVRPAKGVPSTREKLMEDRLRSVITPIVSLYQYPRKLCQITCQILESGESEYEFSQKELSCCINATLLALIDSGLALNSIASSVSMAILKGSDDVIINPTNSQLLQSQSVHVLALQLIEGSRKVKNVLFLDSSGDFTEQQLFNVLEIGEKSCLELGLTLRSIIESKVKSSFIS
ncbi:hypothetical protein Kpol_473p23 [Vanderwaltozyma polyspora DSM 70294]|uniref:Uncharacterized protein n=1 Tax=Vanderwaltozyma polyspora (strain ATCC 22028 / DSM 70294 / BCRC 21397 / CBS 2163 / NBRC 10782 / NRRL Y-8283 / UCD 57-17) TaxID=436907 RepID=A7TQ15_VANPO|nr:uncharacterized protein Kpol_473p23 [Vanderwaltozyma polyspora DSM 70294]EDO15664.1 hypothetical protein Kpol_473p23 [Vanderwaltozyma polyspora DSM 70294]